MSSISLSPRRPGKRKQLTFDKIVDLIEIRAFRLFRLGVFLYGLYEIFKHEIGR